MVFKAAEKNDSEAVAFLIGENADVEISDEKGDFPLLRAAKFGFNEIVSMLLHANASVNQTNPDGASALLAATGRGHRDTVKLLLESGAYLDSVWSVTRATPMYQAILFNYPSIINMLRDHGANMSNPNLYHAAAISGNEKIVDLLHNLGLDVNSKNRFLFVTS